MWHFVLMMMFFFSKVNNFTNYENTHQYLLDQYSDQSINWIINCQRMHIHFQAKYNIFPLPYSECKIIKCMDRKFDCDDYLSLN